MSAAAWRVCPTCPSDDNRWPAAAFSGWEKCHRIGYKVRKTAICNACLYDRYPRVFRPCRTCGGLMWVNRREGAPFPQCQTCRDAHAPACVRCKEPLHHRAAIDGLCTACAGWGNVAPSSAERMVAA